MLGHVQNTKAPVWEALCHSPPYTAAHVDLVYLFSDGWHNWGKSSPLLTFLFTCWAYDPWHRQGTICDQIATQLWLLTIERILRLHVLDDNSLCLSINEGRKRQSSHILSVPFKDVTDLIHFLRYLFTFSPDLITSGNKKQISCFLIHLTGRKDNIKHKNVL